VSYANDIKPMLITKGCMSGGCHGDFFPSSNFVMEGYDQMFVPGDLAKALGMCPIVPGDPENSFLINKLGPNPRSGDRMPSLREPMSDEEIEMIATWVREGAANN